MFRLQLYSGEMAESHHCSQKLGEIEGAVRHVMAAGHSGKCSNI